MAKGKYIASIHSDYYPFVAMATDTELAQFVRAQICNANGEEIPELTGMAKALYDAHVSLAERLEEVSRQKSNAGKQGGSPVLKQSQAEVKQCLSSAEKKEAVVKQSQAVLKPITDTLTITNTIERDRRDTPPNPPTGGEDADEVSPAECSEQESDSVLALRTRESGRKGSRAKKTALTEEESERLEKTFTRFWEAYPRKDGKADAKKAFCKLSPDEGLMNTMLEAIEQMRASPQWQKDGGQYIPMPASWIRGKRWEDKGAAQAPPGRAPQIFPGHIQL